jgi:hypothetical protein
MGVGGGKFVCPSSKIQNKSKFILGARGLTYWNQEMKLTTFPYTIGF